VVGPLVGIVDPPFAMQRLSNYTSMRVRDTGSSNRHRRVNERQLDHSGPYHA
jgi:hypothetical protein